MVRQRASRQHVGSSPDRQTRPKYTILMHRTFQRREIDRSVTSRLCWTILLAFVLVPPAVAQTGLRTNATILDDGTPVLLYPDPSRTPLTMLQSGTPIRAGDGAGDWVNVVFDDPRFGRRVGYVLEEHVQMDNAPPRVRRPQPAPKPGEGPQTSLAANPISTLASSRSGLSVADFTRASPALVTNDLVSGTRQDVAQPPPRRRTTSQRNTPQRSSKRTARRKT